MISLSSLNKCFIEIRLLQLKINHLLHSKVVRPPGKRDSWLGSCCNRRTRNTQDGSWYPSPSGSSEKGKVSKGIWEKLNNMFFDDGALLTNYDWWSWPSAKRGKKYRKDQSTSYRPHTPVLAFLIRASFMLFQHKHPRIYETRLEGGCLRLGEWNSAMTGKHLDPDSADLMAADQLLSDFSLWTPAIMCPRLCWLGLSLGPKNCVNMWISQSFRVQPRLGWQSPTKTEAILA